MKKFIAVTMLALMALSMLLVGVVSAEETGDLTDLDVSEGYTEIEEDPGITPDSAFYGLKRAMERISLALTLALSRVSASPLILLDECLVSLNADLKEACINSLRSSIDGTKTVICINHEDVEGHYDNVISM